MNAKRRLALAALLSIAPSIAPAEIPPDERRSGFEFMSRENQAMQRDDLANPAMLFLGDGEALWNRPEGASERNCAGCHGDAASSMRGVAARYPAFDEALQRPIDLQGKVNQCRSERQAAPPLALEGAELLAVTAHTGRQSRGLPIAPPADPRLTPFRESGRRLFERRIGQLNFSCANCHDDNWGKRLAGNPIPQAHPTGYPLYRLEWQAMGSLQRRLRNCMVGVRAEPYSFGSAEYVELELFLMERARGLPIETPAVRP